MNTNGPPIPPAPFSLAWIRNEIRHTWRWWINAALGVRLLSLVIILFSIYFVFKLPLRFIIGLGNYFHGYFRATLLDVALQESCAAFRKLEAWPIWDLSHSDYLRFQRCLGNEAGFNRQGQFFSALWDLLLYILTLGGTFSFGGSPIIFLVVAAVFVAIYWIFQVLLDLVIWIFSTAWVFALMLATIPVILYNWGFYKAIVVSIIICVICISFFAIGFITSDHVFQALEAALENPVIAPIYGICLNVVHRVVIIWVKVMEISSMERRECLHITQCKCENETNTLKKQLAEAQRINQDLHTHHRIEVSKRDVTIGDLERTIQDLTRERDNYKFVAELPRSTNNTTRNNWEIIAPDQSVALEDARTQIAILLKDADNAKAAKLAEIAAYKIEIDRLTAQIKYSQGAGEDRSQIRTKLDAAEATIRALQRSLKEITFTASELRQSLAKERETHSEKCQNQAVCTRRILELQVERDQFKHYQHESDQLARQSAKAIRGLGDNDVAHLTIRSYLSEMTTKFLELQARGTPGLSTTDLQVELVHRSYAEQTALKDRLEREVERLGGDVEAVRMGRDTTRPQDWKTETLTYEQNHERVFFIYETLAQTVINLEQLLMAFVPAMVPVWRAEPQRNDSSKWPEDSPPDHAQLLQHYATIDHMINPTSPHEPALREKLVVRECQRWYNRGSELLAIAIRVYNDAQMKQSMTPAQATHIGGVLLVADRVFKTALHAVLMESCMLKRDDTERQPSSREKKRFKIYTAMQESITALTNSIRDNQKPPPRWPVMPPAKNSCIARADALATHLIVQEMVVLEARIVQLRRFMEDFRMPGTLHGPVQSQIQGDNGRYNYEWSARVAARTYSELTLAHWMFWKAQKPMQKNVARGQAVLNDKGEPVLALETKLLPLITWDDFMISIKMKNAEVKHLDDKMPDDLVPLYFSDPQLGPTIHFIPKSQLNNGNNNTDNKGKTGNQNNNNNSGNDAEKKKAREQFDRNTARLTQLGWHVRDWGIPCNMAQPQKQQLNKNASLETINKLIAAQDEKIKLWCIVINQANRVVPRWPWKGGPMRPR